MPDSTSARGSLITRGTARAYTIPTDAPEADGTFAWNETTLIMVSLDAGECTGIGYTYGDPVTAPLTRALLEKCVVGESAFAVRSIAERILNQQRNYGHEGIAAMARSAIDVALWDLHAKLVGSPLCNLLGRMRTTAPVYGSGGFTTYSDRQLESQLGAWVAGGIPRVKMKVGTHPADDSRRVRVARRAIGPDTELFVDANGAYSCQQAMALAQRFAEDQVTWFEEPVSSDDLRGLRHLRDHVPAGMDVAAGEYGWDSMYFERMLRADSVDVLQADATRCGGVTGFMDADALAVANGVPFSAHCGPTIHMHLGCCARNFRHLEYFHDHARIESMLFDGFVRPVHGGMTPREESPGLGIVFKEQDAQPYALEI